MSRSAIIIEDNNLLCEGLKQVLRQATDMIEVVAIHSFAGGVSAAREGRHTLVIANASLSRTNLKQAVIDLKAASPDSRVLVLVNHVDTRSLLEAAILGAHGFVVPNAPLEEIKRAIRDVLDGYIYLPTSDQPSASDTADLPSGAPDYARLSVRQLDVARLLAAGAATKVIARSLNLAAGTVKLHLSAIFRALGCNTRAQAIVIMARHPPQ